MSAGEFEHEMAFAFGEPVSEHALRDEGAKLPADRPVDYDCERDLPFQSLDPRHFEILTYLLRTKELAGPKVAVHLMKGVHDQARDVVAYTDGKLSHLLQCKRYKAPMDGEEAGRFLVEVAMYTLLGKPTLDDCCNPLEIELWCTAGFRDTAAEVINTFPQFADTAKAQTWAAARSAKVKALRDLDPVQVADYVVESFRKHVKVSMVPGIAITQRLRGAHEIEQQFFRIRTVVDTEALPRLLQQTTPQQQSPAPTPWIPDIYVLSNKDVRPQQYWRAWVQAESLRLDAYSSEDEDRLVALIRDELGVEGDIVTVDRDDAHSLHEQRAEDRHVRWGRWAQGVIATASTLAVPEEGYDLLALATALSRFVAAVGRLLGEGDAALVAYGFTSHGARMRIAPGIVDSPIQPVSQAEFETREGHEVTGQRMRENPEETAASLVTQFAQRIHRARVYCGALEDAVRQQLEGAAPP